MAVLEMAVPVAVAVAAVSPALVALEAVVAAPTAALWRHPVGSAAAVVAVSTEAALAEEAVTVALEAVVAVASPVELPVLAAKALQ
jgi:hypothetical protein